VSLVAAPEQYNDPGQVGRIGVGDDDGSPPVTAFFVCLVSQVLSPASDALRVRINSAEVLSTSF
jgi:hypothetical protein